MMGYMHEHGEQDFPAKKAAVGRVVHFAELLFAQVGNYGGAIFEGTA